MTGKKYWLGKKLSAEHKQKIIVAQKRKKVYCVELDKVFAGINIAARELSLHQCSITRCCKGKLKTTGGYHFEYFN